MHLNNFNWATYLECKTVAQQLGIINDTRSLCESKDYRAAVAVVKCRDKWLLGLAKNTGDDRNNKWVFPGGGIKSSETPEEAAVREAREETGVHCKAIKVMKDSTKDGVAFVACRSSLMDKLKPNHEFVHLGWFTTHEMKSLELYYNVERLITKAKRYL